MYGMNRDVASSFARKLLDDNGLKDWSVRITLDAKHSFLGLCDYRRKSIIIHGYHIDIHPPEEIKDTIKHEVAHALCPSHGHDSVWAQKARELGCTNTLPCSHLDFPAHVLDAIRSGADVEMTVEEVTHVVRTPTYKVTRLQDKCPTCGKVAKEKFAFDSILPNGDTRKVITLECFHMIVKIIPKGTAFDSWIRNGWRPEIKSCKHEFEKHQCTKCGEFKLMPFQVVGALQAEHGLAVQKGFAIFDDMGLGKTVQGLAIPYFHPDKYKPYLVITKSAVTFQWMKQAFMWNNDVAQIIRTSKDLILNGMKAYIIPYDLLRRLPEAKKVKLAQTVKLVILDECQQVKNPDSTRTQEVRKLLKDPGMKVLPLSGTPWKNRGSEFFTALNFIDPIKFHSYQHFLDTWVEVYYDGKKTKQGGIRNIPKFKEYTSGLLIRREFNEVIENFPDINRMKLNFELDAMSQSNYDMETSKFVDWYQQYLLEGREANGIEILAKMARMRHLIGLAKIPATLGFIEEYVEETDRKLVVFVHHKDVGQSFLTALTDTNLETNEWAELAIQCKEEGIKILAYDANCDRPAIQQTFNESKRAIMIASTLACGEGVDLQTCSDSVLHERQWNPQNEDQATPGRFRRIGQLSKVINITLVEASGTIDEHLDGIVETKRRHYHSAMNKGEAPKWNESDIAQQLAESIVSKFTQRFGSASQKIKVPVKKVG